MAHKLTMRAGALAALIVYGLNLGCSSVREVPGSDAVDNDVVYSLKMKSGEVIQFDDVGGKVNTYQGTVNGRTAHGKTVSIRLSDVQSMRTNRTDTAETATWTIVGVGALVGAFTLLMAWAWDGW
jgi:hypothetical protein